MRKRVFILIITPILFISNATFAKYNQKHGSDYECFYETEYEAGNHGTGNWAYYYCGSQEDKCDGKKTKTHDKTFWLYHGDSFTFAGGKKPEQHNLDTYYCCDGTKDKKGKFVQASSWIDNSKVDRETKQVAGGTCEVRTEYDVCGGKHKVDCDTPGTCNAGYTMRNKACAEICSDGSAFESDKSNKCIECETTNYQGIKTISSENKICIKCDRDTEFFDKETKACIKKSKLKTISKDSMKKCWRCKNNDTFGQCVEIVQKSAPSAEEQKILTSCMVTD